MKTSETKDSKDLRETSSSDIKDLSKESRENKENGGSTKEIRETKDILKDIKELKDIRESSFKDKDGKETRESTKYSKDDKDSPFTDKPFNQDKKSIVSNISGMSIISEEMPKNQALDDFDLQSQRMSEKFNFKGKSKLNMSKMYAPKCICLVSLYPFFNEQTRILKGILKYSRKKKIKKPIELVIQNLIIDVPCPPKGLWKVNKFQMELIA